MQIRKYVRLTYIPQQGLQLAQPDFLDEDLLDFLAFVFDFAFFFVAIVVTSSRCVRGYTFRYTKRLPPPLSFWLRRMVPMTERPVWR